jgi:photosystem II stability/assembly factor-like uncharacterized protein
MLYAAPIMHRTPVLALLVAAGLSSSAATTTRSQPSSQTIDPALYSGLRWRMLGPFRGGRVNAVAGVPGQQTVFYFGSVGGGVWKTQDTGRTWTPIFDSQPVASIGAIALAPSRPDVVYVGTGEADMRDSIAFGDGMYKSTDAGKTWSHIGLETTRQIGKVAVDPTNPDVVFVAALGHFYGPHPDRGVYRSGDGGKTWQKVLYKNDSLGAIDVAIDPRSSQIVYASLWNTRRPPWYIYAPTNGPGGGIYKSTDGGSTWNPLTNGLPSEGFGRSGIAIAPSQPNRVYAIVDAKEGGLFRSDDAGATWTKASADQRLWGRGWYFCKVAVDPKNPDRVYVANTAIYHSNDAGSTWGNPKGSPGGDDYHQLWIHPDNPDLMIAASDQGAIITESASSEQPTWSSWLNQPTAQIYHLAPDYRFPYWITGAQQDSGAVGVATRGKFGQISMRDWEPLCAGGESGYTAPDPMHPEILYGGTVSRCNVATNSDSVNLSPERGMTETPRHAWTQPLVFSRADPHALYYANQFVYKTTDGGQHWAQISQDLTREDPGVPSNLDAAAAADVAPNSGPRRGVIYAIAPSPVQAPLIWIGTDDGYVWVTPDDGKAWANVTPPALTSWSKVVMIEASQVDPNVAYVAVERHQLEDYEPYIYRTRDRGKTWQKIVNGLPAGVYVQTVKEDPRRRGLLFAGTERAVYVSFDDGESWQSLQLNLPATSMRDLAITDTDLVVATHGRGFWMIDDISVLRQVDATVAAAAAHLFKSSDSFSIPASDDNGTPLQKDEPQAQNPPAGAFIDYYIKAASGPVVLDIVDSTGNTIRRYSSDDKPPVNTNPPNVSELWRPSASLLPASPGMHRWVWDLRPTPPGGGRGGRGGGGGFGGGRGGVPLVNPGAYTVKLTVDGQTYTQPLTVKPDPRSAR